MQVKHSLAQIEIAAQDLARRRPPGARRQQYGHRHDREAGEGDELPLHRAKSWK